MNFSNVITILEEEKWETVEELKKARLERLKLSPFENVKFLKKITGAEELEEDILAYESLLDELTKAIEVLRENSTED